MQRGKTARCTLAVSLVLAGFGCRQHVSYSTGPDLSGVSFYGYSQLSGETSDAVTLRMYALNRSRKRVAIEYYPNCGGGSQIRVYRAGKTDEPVWDFEKWRYGDGPAVLSCLRPQMVSSDVVIATSIDPGQSILSDVRSLPVRIILGDSLPPGRYRFSMTSTIGGAPHNLVAAGELTLAKPPVLRTFIVANPTPSEKGVVRGQVIDSLSEEVIRFAFVDFARIGSDGQLHGISENSSNHFSSDSVNTHIPRDGSDGFVVHAKGYYPVWVRYPIRNQEAYRVRVVLQRNPAEQPPPAFEFKPAAKKKP